MCNGLAGEHDRLGSRTHEASHAVIVAKGDTITFFGRPFVAGAKPEVRTEPHKEDLAEIAAVAHASGALMHTDAVQSVGKIPVDVAALGVDLLALSAHKFNGPKGAGALWIKRGTRMLPILTGGKHERNRRAGTENVAAIAGLGVAATLAMTKMLAEAARVGTLRDRLETAILRDVPGTAVNGSREARVPNTTNISFDRIEAESLLIALDLEGVAVST